MHSSEARQPKAACIHLLLFFVLGFAYASLIRDIFLCDYNHKKNINFISNNMKDNKNTEQDSTTSTEEKKRNFLKALINLLVKCLKMLQRKQKKQKNIDHT